MYEPVRVLMNYFFLLFGVIIGGIGGVFFAQHYSSELLNQISVAIAAFAAFSTGLYNILQFQTQRKQQRWEIQKPLLLGLYRRVVEIRPLADEMFYLFLESGDDERTTLKRRLEIDEELNRVRSRYELLDREIRLNVKELTEVWDNVLPGKLRKTLKEYVNQLEEMKKLADGIDPDHFEMYELESSNWKNIEAALRDSCLKASGMQR